MITIIVKPMYCVLWYGNNLFDITGIHNALLETILN